MTRILLFLKVMDKINAFQANNYFTWSLHKKMKFSVKDFFNQCEQIRRKLWICSHKLWICSHLLKILSTENFIFTVLIPFGNYCRVLENIAIQVEVRLKEVNKTPPNHEDFYHKQDKVDIYSNVRHLIRFRVKQKHQQPPQSRVRTPTWKGWGQWPVYSLDIHWNWIISTFNLISRIFINSNFLCITLQIIKHTKTFFSVSRGGSRAAARSKMERFVITVDGWKLDAAALLDPPLICCITFKVCLTILGRYAKKVAGCGITPYQRLLSLLIVFFWITNSLYVFSLL